ncbi:MAG: hypothetical protein ACREBW_10515 [Candidatus Micrarchaeaceae archaeon]
MTEELKESLGAYKIWKNPSKHDESIVYLGEFRPPNGQFHFGPKDLRNLGFGSGNYTVLAPEGDGYPKLFSRWQKVTVPKI